MYLGFRENKKGHVMLYVHKRLNFSHFSFFLNISEFQPYFSYCPKNGLSFIFNYEDLDMNANKVMYDTAHACVF